MGGWLFPFFSRAFLCACRELQGCAVNAFDWSDNTLAACEACGVAIEDFGVALYPPIDLDELSSAARLTADTSSVLMSHLIQGRSVVRPGWAASEEGRLALGSLEVKGCDIASICGRIIRGCGNGEVDRIITGISALSAADS